MGKAVTFMVLVWLVVTLAGGVMQGSTVSIATTALTQDITSSGDTIYVTSTQGFPDTGFIDIVDERIGYASTTSTTFVGTLAQPLVRGANDTDAVAHSSGDMVRSIESSMLNQSINYKLAVLADSSGLLAFVTIPYALISLLASFFVLPLAFLGTDLEILTYIWAAISIGVVFGVGVALVGGRRV